MILFGYLALFCCHIYIGISHEITSDTSKQHELFCVTSPDSATVGNETLILSCQGHNSSEYHTLAYYTKHSSEYFKSYQTYVFEHGNHTPINNVTLKIRGVTHLTFVGKHQGVDSDISTRRAVVDCDGRANTFEFIKHYLTAYHL